MQLMDTRTQLKVIILASIGYKNTVGRLLICKLLDTSTLLEVISIINSLAVMCEDEFFLMLLKTQLILTTRNMVIQKIVIAILALIAVMRHC